MTKDLLLKLMDEECNQRNPRCFFFSPTFVLLHFSEIAVIDDAFPLPSKICSSLYELVVVIRLRLVVPCKVTA